MGEMQVKDAYSIAVIGGDGIGPEVVAEGLKVLDAVTGSGGPKFATTDYDLGARRWHATGETLPDSVLEELRGHDAILLGAIGDPTVPSGVLERGVLLPLRFALDHYVNLRPAKLFPGVASPLDVARVAPNGIDFVVVREGTDLLVVRELTGGIYFGDSGRDGDRAHDDCAYTVAEVATEVSVNTRYGVERVVRDAFARAQARPRRHLTLVHKHNVLTYAGHLWRRTVEEVGAEFPEVETAYQHVDAATIFMATDPGRFDVIVTDNLFGDILTDIAAAIAGGIGLAASGNINPARTTPSMFEPVHGSAPDIAGQSKADPTAAILSVGMLLAHLGLDAAAERVDTAVAADLADRGDAVRSTTAVGDAVVGRL
jgi:3-isopropylmalate dehydrogenase